ncbi:unknown [Clostridium sp. CAG:269]|jgi:hypothetical protein|nr:unknown [Clostridium sp. CAG:269]
MSEEIIKVIDELGKRFGIVIDWSSQNIIPYLQELLKRFICYRNITACVWIIVSIAMTISGFVMIKFLNKWRKSENYDSDYYGDDELLALLGYIFSICMIALGIGLIIGNILGIVENICMPEMVVYEYIKNIQ